MTGWLDSILAVPGLAWLIAAGLLAIAELLSPGIFLIFIAAGAGVAGAVTLLVPAFPLIFQVTLFVVASAAAVAVGRNWYRTSAVGSSDPLLNDRLGRLVGQVVTVAEPIVAGQGRVRVGDGEWPAHGPDLPAGATVRVVGAQSAWLDVEPV
jgi:inner membrane protein